MYISYFKPAYNTIFPLTVTFTPPHSVCCNTYISLYSYSHIISINGICIQLQFTMSFQLVIQVCKDFLNEQDLNLQRNGDCVNDTSYDKILVGRV